MDNKKYYPVFTLFSRLFLHTGVYGNNTFPIYVTATRPRLGTIGKNHIQSSFIFCIKLLFLSALNLILSLRIISQIILAFQHYIYIRHFLSTSFLTKFLFYCIVLYFNQKSRCLARTSIFWQERQSIFENQVLTS